MTKVSITREDGNVVEGYDLDGQMELDFDAQWAELDPREQNLYLRYAEGLMDGDIDAKPLVVKCHLDSIEVMGGRTDPLGFAKYIVAWDNGAPGKTVAEKKKQRARVRPLRYMPRLTWKQRYGN